MSPNLRPFWCLFILLSAIACPAAEPVLVWPKVSLPQTRDVELGGPVGMALQHGISRLAQPPYSVDWLLSDVSFKVNRIFTNYSGDVSGRFIELA